LNAQSGKTGSKLQSGADKKVRCGYVHTIYVLPDVCLTATVLQHQQPWQRYAFYWMLLQRGRREFRTVRTVCSSQTTVIASIISRIIRRISTSSSPRIRAQDLPQSSSNSSWCFRLYTSPWQRSSSN